MSVRCDAPLSHRVVQGLAGGRRLLELRHRGRSRPGVPARGLQEEGRQHGQQEDVGHHRVASLGESEVEDEAEREEPDGRRELRRERAGHGGGDRQGRRGEQGGDEGEPPQAAAARLVAGAPLGGEGEPSEEGEREVEGERQGPRALGHPAPGEEEEGEARDRGQGPQGGQARQERHGGQREDGGRRVGNVAHDEPGQARRGPTPRGRRPRCLPVRPRAAR